MGRSLGDELGVSRCHGMAGNQVLHKVNSFIVVLLLVGEIDWRHSGTSQSKLTEYP